MGKSPAHSSQTVESQVRRLLQAAPLYAIIPSSLRTGLTAAAVLESLLRAGVRVLQYRHKGPFGRSEFETCVQMAQRIRQAGGAFVVNDRTDVAALCNAHGVHLGQEDLPPAKARALLQTRPGSPSLIGYSTHSRQQVEAAIAEPVDYIAIGPVFPTRTKQNPDPVVGVAMVSQIRKLTDLPIVAIGGITLENAPALMEAGADGVAVVGDVMEAPNIEERAAEFLARLRKAARNPA
jgi:thiamine-phosphate pyrophosphorylase